MLLPAQCARFLNNHLRHTLSTKSLAANEGLSLDSSGKVAERRKREEDGGGNEGCSAVEKTEEEDDGHDGIGGGAHVIRGDLANGGVELGGGRADAQEEGHLDEEDTEGEAASKGVSVSRGCVFKRDGRAAGIHSNDGDDYDEDAEGEDRANACRETENHGQNAEPRGQSVACYLREVPQQYRIESPAAASPVAWQAPVCAARSQ